MCKCNTNQPIVLNYMYPIQIDTIVIGLSISLYRKGFSVKISIKVEISVPED